MQLANLVYDIRKTTAKWEDEIELRRPDHAGIIIGKELAKHLCALDFPR